jgi:hypothetical protein
LGLSHEPDEYRCEGFELLRLRAPSVKTEGQPESCTAGVEDDDRRMASRPFVAGTIHDRLDWHEICRRYPDRWVILAGIEWPHGRSSELRSALVLAHASTRDAALDAARSVLHERIDEFACFFTTRYMFWSRPDGRPGGRL